MVPTIDSPPQQVCSIFVYCPPPLLLPDTFRHSFFSPSLFSYFLVKDQASSTDSLLPSSLRCVIDLSSPNFFFPGPRLKSLHRTAPIFGEKAFAKVKIVMSRPTVFPSSFFQFPLTEVSSRFLSLLTIGNLLPLSRIQGLRQRPISFQFASVFSFVMAESSQASVFLVILMYNLPFSFSVSFSPSSCLSFDHYLPPRSDVNCGFFVLSPRDSVMMRLTSSYCGLTSISLHASFLRQFEDTQHSPQRIQLRLIPPLSRLCSITPLGLLNQVARLVNKWTPTVTSPPVFPLAFIPGLRTEAPP